MRKFHRRVPERPPKPRPRKIRNPDRNRIKNPHAVILALLALPLGRKPRSKGGELRRESSGHFVLVRLESHERAVEVAARDDAHRYPASARFPVYPREHSRSPRMPPTFISRTTTADGEKSSRSAPIFVSRGLFTPGRNPFTPQSSKTLGPSNTAYPKHWECTSSASTRL